MCSHFLLYIVIFLCFFTGTRTTSSISSSAATSSNTTGGLNKMRTCVGCGGQIHDQFILQVAPNLEWHAACLKCSQCHKFLDEKCTCFVRDGKCFVYIMTMQSATYIHTPLINFVHRRRPAMTSSSITNVNNVNHSSHSSSLTTQ